MGGDVFAAGEYGDLAEGKAVDAADGAELGGGEA